MKLKWNKVALATIMSGALIVGNFAIPVSQVPAAYAATAPHISNQSIKIDGQSSVKISDAHLLMQDQGKVLSFTVSYTNNGNKELNLIDYWVRAKNKSGKSFKVSTIEQDKNKRYVAPNSTVDITYYAVVDKQAKITDFQFDLIKWDFSASNYERRLGTITYPANGTDTIAAFAPKHMIYENIRVKGAVKQAIVNKDQTSTFLTINYLVENTGFKSVNLGKLNFVVQTDNQLVYDVDVADLSAINLQPRERRIITVHAVIPNASGAKSFSLAAAIKDESQVNIPIGIFALPKVGPLTATPIGKERIVYLDGQTLRSSISEALIADDDDKKYVYIQLDVENNGTTTLKSPELDFAIQTTGGTLYPMTYDKDALEILVGDKKSIQISAELPSSINLNKSELVLRTKSKDQNILIGSYAINDGQLSNPTPVGEVKNVVLGENKIAVEVKESFTNKIENNNYLFTEIQFSNTSRNTVDIAQSDFLIKTSDGTTYPLTFVKEELTIPSGDQRTLQISGIIPDDADIESSELIARLSHDSNKGFVLSSFLLNNESQQGNIGGEFLYKDFKIAVNNVQRSYTEASDLIVADISVTNTSNGSKSILDLGGYFVVNGVKIDPAKTSTLKLDNVQVLAPNEKYNFVVYTEIPYTMNIKQISFVVTENEANQKTKILNQFSDTKTSTVAKKDKDFVYKVESMGKNSEVRLRNTAVYEDGRNKFFYAEVELTSKERRAVDLNNLGGYIQANGKAVIPVTFSKYEEKVFPDGRVLLTAFARIPNNYYQSELDFYIGQSVSTAEEGKTGSALIRPVGFKLKAADIVTSQNGLSEINYLDYALSINQVYASFNVRDGGNASSTEDFNGIKLDLHYDLNKLQDYENNFEDHKLIIELVDGENKFVSYSKELTIDYFKQGAEYLEVGDKKVKKIVFLDENAFFAVTQRTYILNIYHEYDGNRFLIATKQNVW